MLDLFSNQWNVYVPPMQLGSGVDAITGDVARGNAFASNPNIQKLPPRSPLKFSYSIYDSAEQLRKAQNKSFTGSITGSIALVNTSVELSHSYEVCHQETVATCSKFIHLEFEEYGEGQGLVNPSQHMSEEALAIAKNNVSKFRNTYGDYFVSEICPKRQFTALL